MIDRRENKKEMVLDFLRKEALRSVYWHTKASIAKEAGLPYSAVAMAVVEMASEGFLELRDGDTENIDYHIALKKSLRQER